MKSLLRKLLVVTSILLSISSRAEDKKKELVGFKAGVGVLRSASDYVSEVRIFSLFWERPLWESIYHKAEVGAFFDTKTEQGRKSSWFLSYQAGPKITYKYMYVEAMTGVGFITAPDAYLGGPFQFFHDIGLGFKDESGFGIGLGYKHISSAGIYNPNMGRDFTYLKLTIPFSF